MIGTGIRKFARERGMTCGAGRAYGKVNGRYISMEDGEGTKTVHIYLYPPVEAGGDAAQMDEQILQVLTDCDLKEFRLHRKGAVSLKGGFAHLVFFDTIGTMDRIIRYLDEIMPRLDGLNLDGDRCAYCGNSLNGDVDFIELDGNVMPLHTGCKLQLNETVNAVEEEARGKGSLLKGTLGALVGALGGAVVYAVIFALGYIAGLAGLLIGWFSSALYDKFGGKKSKLKLLIVAVMLVLGILLGQVAGYTVEFGKLYNEIGYTQDEYPMDVYLTEAWEMYLLYDQETALGKQYDRLMADVPVEERGSDEYWTREKFIQQYYDGQIDVYRTELRDNFNRNLMLGLFYGLLGCLGVFLRVHQQNRCRMRDLK